jgi:hypothetical protein
MEKVVRHTWNKWISMTKSEILAELKRTGQLDNRRRSPEWEKAFQLYNELHPNNKLNQSCGSCYAKCRSWLMS